MYADMAEQVVVIGSGPAAWSAAIYAARSALKPVVYEGAITEENRIAGTLPLGQLNLVGDVGSFPGFPSGVLGPDLIMRMRAQAEHAGARIVTEDAVGLEVRRTPFLLRESGGAVVRTRSVILATGGVRRTLGLPSVDRFTNKGVSFDPVSDAPLPRMRNRPDTVVGGGDAAADAALWLTKFSRPVYVICRRARLRAGRRLARRLVGHPDVRILYNAVAVEVVGDDPSGMTGLRIRDALAGEERVIAATGLFPAIGWRPNSALVKGQLGLDDEGYVRLTRPPGTATSVAGVFAAGEVADPVYRQAVSAAAMGCQAALDARRWLAAQGTG